ILIEDGVIHVLTVFILADLSLKSLYGFALTVRILTVGVPALFVDFALQFTDFSLHLMVCGYHIYRVCLGTVRERDTVETAGLRLEQHGQCGGIVTIGGLAKLPDLVHPLRALPLTLIGVFRRYQSG